METDLIIMLAKGEIPSDIALEGALHDICDNVHSDCDEDCPIYELTDGELPDAEGRGCDCFKDGKAMLKFIRGFDYERS